MTGVEDWLVSVGVGEFTTGADVITSVKKMPLDAPSCDQLQNFSCQLLMWSLCERYMSQLFRAFVGSFIVVGIERLIRLVV